MQFNRAEAFAQSTETNMSNMLENVSNMKKREREQIVFNEASPHHS